MITGYATVESAVEALKTGAEEYLAKPFTDEELFAAVDRVIGKLRARRDARAAARGRFGLVGESEGMRRAFVAMELAARQTGPGADPWRGRHRPLGGSPCDVCATRARSAGHPTTYLIVTISPDSNLARTRLALDRLRCSTSKTWTGRHHPCRRESKTD